MKTLLCLLLFSVSVAAHPGVGIVQDSRGNVFFTDLKQVWKIAPDGKKSVAVPNVHTHELSLDNEDNLYGEHLWYAGDKWSQRDWCLKRDGALVDVIPAHTGFRSDYSFVRDRAGNLYWAERGTPTVIKKRAPNGQLSTHATGDFRDVRWMTAAADGTLFLIDREDLRRVSPTGAVTTMVQQLRSQPAKLVNLVLPRYYAGLWTDGAGGVYVALYDERCVVKVEPDNKVVLIARSPAPWSPAGGTFDRDGNLWLLENSDTNTVRVRHLKRDGSEQIF